jgi:hypothetical protein
MLKQRLAAQLRRLAAATRQLAPYLLVELLLPGGSMIAVLLWILRGRLRLPLRRATDRFPAKVAALHVPRVNP